MATHQERMQRCIKIHKGNKSNTAAALNVVMREHYGSEPPQNVSWGIVSNVASGQTKCVEAYISMAMDKMIRSDELGVKNG